MDKNFTIGVRLREERERLALSQARLGEIGQVTSLTQRNYEKDERRPDAGYLATVAVLGIDVLYVITGQRSQPVSAESALPKEERALVNSYRLCNAAARKNLLQTAALLAAGLGQAPAPAPAPAPVKMRIGNLTQNSTRPESVQVGQVGGDLTVGVTPRSRKGRKA